MYPEENSGSRIRHNNVTAQVTLLTPAECCRCASVSWGKKILCKLRFVFRLSWRAAKSLGKKIDRHSNQPIVDELRVKRTRDFDHISMWNCARCCRTDKCFEQRVFVLKIENSDVIFRECMICVLFFLCFLLPLFLQKTIFVSSRCECAAHVDVRSTADFRRVLITNRVHSMFIWVWR